MLPTAALLFVNLGAVSLVVMLRRAGRPEDYRYDVTAATKVAAGHYAFPGYEFSQGGGLLFILGIPEVDGQ